MWMCILYIADQDGKKVLQGIAKVPDTFNKIVATRKEKEE